MENKINGSLINSNLFCCKEFDGYILTDVMSTRVCVDVPSFSWTAKFHLFRWKRLIIKAYEKLEHVYPMKLFFYILNNFCLKMHLIITSIIWTS